jgi:transglutaminase-like putative cysteine protease
MAPPFLSGPLPPVQLLGIPDGIEGVRVTLAHMARLVREWRHRPELTEIARRIVGDLPEKDHVAEMVALFEFARDEIRYIRDTNGVERIQTPEYTLRERQGDCDDKAILLAALLESIGIPARFVAVGFSPDFFEHVYIEAMPDFVEWIALDATERVNAGWAPPDPVTRINQGI